jgi:transcriptional regulator with XRE-family HTH domain
MIIYDNNMNGLLSISDQLKRRRLEAGLSLSVLAGRVGTSAATLSRYEHGWTRFETHTLRKLATALGCELRIELVSRPTIFPSGVSKAQAVKQLTRLFWDHHLVPSDFGHHPVWITERVLEYGTMQDVNTLRAILGNERFLTTVARATRVSPRTATFWQHLLKQEGIPCMKKSYRNTAWHS